MELANLQFPIFKHRVILILWIPASAGMTSENYLIENLTKTEN